MDFAICVICVKTSLNPLAPCVKSFASALAYKGIMQNYLMIHGAPVSALSSDVIGPNISATRRSEEGRQRKQHAINHVSKAGAVAELVSASDERAKRLDWDCDAQPTSDGHYFTTMSPLPSDQSDTWQLGRLTVDRATGINTL
jgi:hypothetical protein